MVGCPQNRSHSLYNFNREIHFSFRWYSLGNTSGNSLITGIFSKFTCSLLESRIKAKKASQPFLRKRRASIAEITLGIDSDQIPCTVSSDRLEHLSRTIFLSQSTMARCLDNISIPNIKSNS